MTRPKFNNFLMAFILEKIVAVEILIKLQLLGVRKFQLLD
jgi:hypothetical protein